MGKQEKLMYGGMFSHPKSPLGVLNVGMDNRHTGNGTLIVKCQACGHEEQTDATFEDYFEPYEMECEVCKNFNNMLILPTKSN